MEKNNTPSSEGHIRKARDITMVNNAQNALEDNDEIPANDLTKPIDLVHLSRQTFGSKDLEKEVLSLFLSHSRQCLERMRQSETDDAFADAAHSIKGSARAVGAFALANLVETSETMARAGHLEDKAAAVVEIEAGINSTNQYIELLQRGM